MFIAPPCGTSIKHMLLWGVAESFDHRNRRRAGITDLKLLSVILPALWMLHSLHFDCSWVVCSLLLLEICLSSIQFFAVIMFLCFSSLSFSWITLDSSKLWFGKFHSLLLKSMSQTLDGGIVFLLLLATKCWQWCAKQLLIA